MQLGAFGAWFLGNKTSPKLDFPTPKLDFSTPSTLSFLSPLCRREDPWGSGAVPGGGLVRNLPGRWVHAAVSGF